MLDIYIVFLVSIKRTARARQHIRVVNMQLQTEANTFLYVFQFVKHGNFSLI